MANRTKEWKRIDRIRKRAKGECYDCDKPAYYDSTRCLRCLELDAKRAGRWKARNQKYVREFDRKRRTERKAEGKCIACGCLLDEYDSQTKCMNCNQRIHSEDYKPHLAKRL